MGNPYYLTLRGVARILNILKPLDYRLYAVSYLCFIHGLRISEVLALSTDDVDFIENRITLRRMKKSNTTNALMSEEEIDILGNLLPDPPEKLFFHNYTRFIAAKAMKTILSTYTNIPTRMQNFISLKATYIIALLSIGCGTSIVYKIVGDRYKCNMKNYIKLCIYDPDEVLLDFNKQIYAKKMEIYDRKFLNRKEISKLLQVNKKTNYLLYAPYQTAFTYGLSFSELLRISLTDIDFTQKQITIQRDNGNITHAPISKLNQQIFFKIIPNAVNEILFGSFDEEILMQNLTRQSKRYGLKMDILAPDIFKSSFAVFMLDNRYDIRELKEMLGLNKLSETMLYLKAFSYQFDIWQMEINHRLKKEMGKKSIPIIVRK